MSKRASLEPKKTTKSHVPWLVNLPPALSNTGRRERRYYDNKKDAAEFCRQQKIRLENYGASSTYLPPGKVEEAQAAFEKLQGTGIGLVEAVERVLKWERSRETSVTFKEMFERFMEARKDAGRSAPYLTALRCTLPRFAELHDRVACEMSAGEIEDQLTGMSPSVRNAFLRYLRAAFNFGIRKEWCVDNPVKRIEMQRLRMRREILTNPQVTALLKATVETDLELLPYHLFCVFAGIRPEEVQRLEWTNVKAEERHIEVPDEAAKMDMRRTVDMEPLLRRWLDYYVLAGGKTNGAVVPQKNLRKRLRAIRARAAFERWPQDAPRRTYASNWLAAYHNVDKLNNNMGHTSPTMLWKHYHRAVTRKQAKAFWKIGPPKA
jgi:integrase